MMKTCRTCGEVKPRSEFGINKQYKDGLNTACKDCTNARLRAYYAANKEACDAKSRRWREAHPERVWTKAHPEKAKASRARFRAENRDRRKAEYKEYRENNKEKEALRHKKYTENNREKQAEKEARRRDRIRIATPVWANLRVIEGIYAIAKKDSSEYGVPLEVDHIVPINGLCPQTNEHIVCGLHVEDNLQILTAEDHRIKGGRLWPDMP